MLDLEFLIQLIRLANFDNEGIADKVYFTKFIPDFFYKIAKNRLI